MQYSTQQILLDLNQDVISELHIKRQHFFDLLSPLKNQLIHKKSSVKHGCIFIGKHSIRGILHPVRIKTSMI